MCSNIGTPNKHHFPFGTNGKVVVLGVPILKHFRVLHYGQTVHLKKKMEGHACFLKVFFGMNPIARRKAKIVHNFGLSECNSIKRKIIVLSKDIKIIYFAIFFFIFFLTVRSMYMHSEKKKFPTYLP